MSSSKWKKIVSNVRSTNPPEEVKTFNYISHISLKHGYLYVETPKVCCSTIKRTLINAELGFVVDFQNFEDIHDRRRSPLIDPSKVFDLERFIDSDIFKFCFVRNPYSRLLSSYLNKIVPLDAWRRHKVLMYHGLSPGSHISFKQFIDFVCHQEFIDMDIHWRLQYDLLCGDIIKYNFVGKFESFDIDFLSVLDKVKIDSSSFMVKEMRHATMSERNLPLHYTSELRTKVFSKFFIDFNFYGYKR